MKMKPNRMDARRGSALLASMIVVTVLCFAAAGILSYSLNTYENSMRQAILDNAREVADSEMEYLYFGWKNVLISRQVAIDSVAASSQMSQYLSAGATPFDQDMLVTPISMPQWTVTRSIAFNRVGASTGDGSAEGIVNGNLTGKNYYFTAETSASFSSPVLGTVTYHTGRHFAYSSTPLFQYAVFYQGDLELAPGSNMAIEGPVSTNASAYLGSQSGFSLTLTDNVAYFQYYNGATDPMSGETDILEGTSVLTDPVYNPNPADAAPSDQTAQRQIQVTKMTTQASFIGGVDVAADLAVSAYNTPANDSAYEGDPNEIYRAVVAPPPTSDGTPTGTPLPEDSVVAASRMYNTAGLLITINQPASGPATVNVGTAANPSAYDSEPAFSSIVNPGAAGSGAVIQDVRATVVDPREYVNGTSAVNMTTVDVGNLKNALAAAMADNPTLAATTGYNGVVYVYDDTTNTNNTLNAIRVTDGQTTPDYRDANGNPLGFSVVSNNGVYIQGDYNTTEITVPGVATQVTNPTAVMGDAVTVLSSGWSITNNATLQPINNRQATDATAVANGTDTMVVNTAILTGNTPSSVAGDYNSGGAQNLVRMIEDWYNSIQTDGNYLTLELNGSLGQLFTSKYFTSHYRGNAAQAALGNQPIYTQPRTRDFYYDKNFKDRAPAGAPTTTAFTRGDFFFW